MAYDKGTLRTVVVTQIRAVEEALKQLISVATAGSVEAVATQEIRNRLRQQAYAGADLVDSSEPAALATLAPAEALASAARTATTNSADIVNTRGRGVAVLLNLTAFTTAADLTLKIQRKNADGTYTDILTGVSITATGKSTYILDAVAGAEAGGFTKTAAAMLPQTWRVSVVHGNANSHTYSVGYYPF